MRVLVSALTLCLLALPVQARYSGGSGTADDPYRIATAADLTMLGKARGNLSEHYILTADIDLDPNLPGRTVFDKSVIGRAGKPPFSGVFDGDGHTIAHLTIVAEGGHLGLFGVLAAGAEVKNLGVVDINVSGSGNTNNVGGLAGFNEGVVTRCYSTGVVMGNDAVGGLVGSNEGAVTNCYSVGAVEGNDRVGGLLGENWATVTACHSGGTVTGVGAVPGTIGGLVGRSEGHVIDCYSGAQVAGLGNRGGLVGHNAWGTVIACYSTGTVSGIGRPVRGDPSAGGLVGVCVGVVAESFWDIETSGQTTSAGGTGLTTAQMQMAETFVQWGGCERDGIWTIDEGNDYPRLWWEEKPGMPLAKPVAVRLSDVLAGGGAEEDPYLIYTEEDLAALSLAPCDWDEHFRLMGDIDLSGYTYDRAWIAPHVGPTFGYGMPDRAGWWPDFFCGTPFTGVFDGNGHTISHLTIVTGGDYLGLFGQVESGAEIKNLGVVDVNITASDQRFCAGGVVGTSRGAITNCYSAGGVWGAWYVGGLVGRNDGGSIAASYGAGQITGYASVGGLVGTNGGSVSNCYSAGAVSGTWGMGGLVGYHSSRAGTIAVSFWDVDSSGLPRSDGGTGLTTAEMQTATTFLEAGWDFVDETENGTDDIWWILEGQDYPRLWWEADGEVP